MLSPSQRVVRILLGLLAAIGLASALPAQPSATAPDPVRLQLKWRHQFQFAGYYAAIAQGYYRDAGLEVQLREAVPGHDPVDAVLNGEAEFGVGTSELVLLRAKGKPVVVLAAIYQHSPLVLLAGHAPGIEDLQALSVLPLMIEPQSAELFAYFRNEGIDPAKLHVVHHTFEVKDLLAGRVGAMSAYSTDEPFQLKAAGVDYLTFTPRAGGIDFYGDNLFTTATQVAQHPERVRAFRQASLRGWEYALAHPTELADLILKNYSQRKSRAALLFEAEQTAQLMHTDLVEVGHMNPGRWRHIADTYAEFGMLPRGFNLAGLLYDPYPQPDLRWAYWALGALAVITVAALFWIIPLVSLNRQLRRAKEAAESANEAKSRYLAFLTHEIRTPLNGLVGVVDLMGSGPITGEQREQVQLLEHATQNLLRLVDNVLDYSKIEAGRLRVELLPLSLPDFLQGLGELYEVATRAKGVALHREIGPGVPAAIFTDPVRLRQILANLLSNAVKFTATGAITLLVESVPGEPAGSHRLRFQVRDTGVGIPDDQLATLFEPFVQADETVARRYGGSGLGLSISRELAQLLGGTLTVRSQPGAGSAFTLEMVAREVFPDAPVQGA